MMSPGARGAAFLLPCAEWAFPVRKRHPRLSGISCIGICQGVEGKGLRLFSCRITERDGDLASYELTGDTCVLSVLLLNLHLALQQHVSVKSGPGHISAGNTSDITKHLRLKTRPVYV